MQWIRTALRSAMAAAAVFVLMPTTATGQSDYPSRPVRIVVPFAAGGATDIMARFVADRLGKELGQPFIVENKAGANGGIGSEHVAKSDPDGYTLLMVTAGTHAINASLYKKLPYDPVRDFAPVALVGFAPNVLVVNPGVPAKDVAQLVALARAQPKSLHFGSAGSGSTLHLSGELFKKMTGTELVHVPYKGGSLAMKDLLGGQIQMMFDSISSALPQIQAGKLRALAVTSAKRSPQLPDVPTMQEAGVSGYEALAWFGLVAPAGTPAATVNRLNGAVQKILATEDAKEQLARLGSEPAGGTAADFGRHIQSEVAKWAEVVRAAGAQVD